MHVVYVYSVFVQPCSRLGIATSMLKLQTAYTVCLHDAMIDHGKQILSTSYLIYRFVWDITDGESAKRIACQSPVLPTDCCKGLSNSSNTQQGQHFIFLLWTLTIFKSPPDIIMLHIQVELYVGKNIISFVFDILFIHPLLITTCVNVLRLLGYSRRSCCL